MTTVASIGALPHALRDEEELGRRFAGRRPAVFLDYDGTLTPIVDRPEDASSPQSMREAVRGLADRCTVCVVSGRDRPCRPGADGRRRPDRRRQPRLRHLESRRGTLEHEAGGGFEELIERVTARVREEADPIEGSLVEPKKASVAFHYRLVADADRPRIAAIVDRLLADHPDELKVTPGKMVYEIQPKLDWDKGKAVLYLSEALGLDGDDVVPALPRRRHHRRARVPRAIRERASAYSSAEPTIRRSAAVARPPRSCWTRSRRRNDFWTGWLGERGARRGDRRARL